MKRRAGPGRPTAEGSPAEFTFRICMTKERKQAYKKAAGELPVFLWAKRNLDRVAGYKPQ